MKITKDQTISKVLNKNPETEEVFSDFGMHCLGCPTATGESLEQAAMVHGINLDEMLTELNKKANK